MTRHQLGVHDYEHPDSFTHAIEAENLRATLPPCPACQVSHLPLPGPGTTWVVESTHEPGCPAHDGHVVVPPTREEHHR